MPPLRSPSREAGEPDRKMRPVYEQLSAHLAAPEAQEARGMTRDARSRHLAHLRKLGICTRCQKAETQRFALCLKCRQGQARAQRARQQVDTGGYDGHQQHPRPCACGRKVTNTSQCEKWKAERDTTTCPYTVLHQPRTGRREAAA